MKDGFHINSYGTKYWIKNNTLHRLDGPAVIDSDGYKEWWYEENLLVITDEVISELLEVIG